MSRTPRIAARLPKPLRKRLDRAVKSSNQSDTAFVIAAIEEFLINHPTTADKIAAIVHSRTVAATE